MQNAVSAILKKGEEKRGVSKATKHTITTVKNQHPIVNLKFLVLTIWYFHKNRNTRVTTSNEISAQVGGYTRNQKLGML